MIVARESASVKPALRMVSCSKRHCPAGRRL